jgi:dUTP pyrophosphatase
MSKPQTQTPENVKVQIPELLQKVIEKNTTFGLLKIYTSNEELKRKYLEYIEKHNTQISTDKYPNSGFDLFCPNEYVFSECFITQFLDLGVKCEMFTFTNTQGVLNVAPTGFYMYPRSSMSKTPLMLANHTGIIDSGYRGNLIAAVRQLPTIIKYYSYKLEKNARLFQICHPSLCPIYVEILDEDVLSQTTRGEGGFGSTGK